MSPPVRQRRVASWVFRNDDDRRASERVRALAGQLLSLRHLPPAVTRFYLRGLFTSWRERDKYTVDVAIRPRELAELLTVAQGRRRVAELGTASGWSAIALALSDSGRTIDSYDPVARPERELYLRLVDSRVRARITFHQQRGEDATPIDGVDLVFDDASHEHEPTLAAFRLWSPHLVSGGIVAIHDYGDPAYPGVESAVAELGLDGRRVGSLYVWEKRG